MGLFCVCDSSDGKEVSSGFELTGEEDVTTLYEIKGLYKNNNHTSDTVYIFIDKEIKSKLTDINLKY